MNDIGSSLFPKLAPRAADAHKGDFGKAWIVGGSLGMAGAPALAGKACLRSGVGLISIAAPRCVQPTVAGFLPDFMTAPLDDDGCSIAESALPTILECFANATAGAIGPGMGRSDGLDQVVARVYEQVRCPLVVDADALNALATNQATVTKPGGPRILTPHPGEFARLRGKPLADPRNEAERVAAAGDYARLDPTGQTIVLLKGRRTVVTDGVRYAVNTTGNPGMATGGSGDVLTGVLTALLCQGMSLLDAARLGAHVHGIAGDLAATELGEMSLTASDLVGWLPAAWKACQGPA